VSFVVNAFSNSQGDAKMHSTVRHPAVAGRFYPKDRETLQKELRSYFPTHAASAPALGCVAPHAGYVYSGAVAGAVFANLDLPQRIIVLCPNHTGKGPPLAIMSSGAWETPLGPIPIDFELAEALKKRFPLLTEDADAHRSEHAIEVELPFLQVRRPGFTFVPIALGTRQFDILEKLGEAIADTVLAQDERILIVASSDMNHYENDAVTRIKDHQAIEPMLALDARGLFDVVTKEQISMCGFGPTVVMLTATKRLGATKAELVKYATSGDVSGDREMVVGYAGVVVR
jgi:MEMO1 family protein